MHNQRRFQSIEVTFPERGHSYIECDRDMGLVNTKASASVLSVWMTIFKAARKSPAPYYVTEVRQDMVKNFSEFLRLYKKSCRFPTRPIRDMIFDRGEGPGTVSQRES